MQKLLILCFSLVAFSTWAADETCDCPKLKCDPCSFEKNITFYTTKCGPQYSRLKSCTRPTCIPISEATKECPVAPGADSGAREPVDATPTLETADVNAETHIVGIVRVLGGGVTLVRADGHRSHLSGEAKVRETDSIDTAVDGRAIVEFVGGNKLHIHPATVVEVREYKDAEDADARKVFLQLIKGKVRNQVQQKYNGKVSSYRVFTSGAVAGVRGTDFVVEHHEERGVDTRIEVLEGHVKFASLDDTQKLELNKGDGATFFAALPDPTYKSADVSEYIRRGRLSPIYKINATDLHELDLYSRVDVARTDRPKTRNDVQICDKPKAFLDQCAWTCIGNPPKEKACRVDLPAVRCVRQRCNANGNWAESADLPAVKVSATPCSGTASVVKACDY